MSEQAGVTVISPELAQQAVGVLQELLDGGREAEKRDLVRHRAAESLLRLFQTQEKVAALTRAGDPPRGTSQGMRDLSVLTDDDLNEITEQMLRDNPDPRKKSAA